MNKSKLKTRVDWSFIHELEGCRLNGYVPLDSKGKVLGKSGVTVGYGFDIGQHSAQEITNLNLPHSLFVKIVSYVGLRGEAAKNFIEYHPLSITKKEADKLDRIVQEKKVKELEKLFNNYSLHQFKSLPKEAQTVIMSVYYQYGNLRTRTPRFFKYVTGKDWLNAIKELRNFGDDYPTRRNKEADYLLPLLKGITHYEFD